MKFHWKGKDWYIDGFLATQLNSIVSNMVDDWDFIIIITGDRTVRVGKSVLGMTVCAYIAYMIHRMHKKARGVDYTINDIYFDNKVMMEEAQKKPPYSLNHYDEGREGLAASKAMKGFQQDLIDFFNECGQLNHCFVVVCPDFFTMKEDIAVARSEFLINVYRKETATTKKLFDTGERVPVVRLDRGYFEFFSRHKKQKLYDMAKSTRRKSYSLVKPDFIGRFTNQYPLDEEAYRAKKKDSLSRFAERHKEQKETKDDKAIDNFIISMRKEGKTSEQIAKLIGKYLGREFTSAGIRMRKAWKAAFEGGGQSSNVNSTHYTSILTESQDNEVIVL